MFTDEVTHSEKKIKEDMMTAETEIVMLSLISNIFNTSFIERLNPTLGQATAYLTRRTTCHARRQEQLKNQVEIVPLKFPPIPQIFEVWNKNENSRDASRPDKQKTLLQRNFNHPFSFNNSGQNQTADWICHDLQDKGSVEINS